jgi:hypothetical protein
MKSTTPLVPKKSSAAFFGHAVISVLFPWLLFVGTLAAYFWLYHLGSDGSLGLLLVGGIILLELFICTFLFMSRKAWVQQLGHIVMFAIIAGVVAGLFNEYTNMAYYHKYVALNEYSNVLPTAPIQGILDAGVLHFASNAVIDTQRAASFKSFTTPGTTFCVAPVLDSTFTNTDEIGIWAVGTNCCGKRSSFYCDDVDKGAMSAIVVLPAEEVLPEWLSSVGFGATNFEDYSAAIKLAAAVHGTAIAREVRFVRWIADTQQFILQYYMRGMQFAGDAAVLAIVLLFAGVVMLIVSGNRM